MCVCVCDNLLDIVAGGVSSYISWHIFTEILYKSSCTLKPLHKHIKSHSILILYIINYWFILLYKYVLKRYLEPPLTNIISKQMENLQEYNISNVIMPMEEQ